MKRILTVLVFVLAVIPFQVRAATPTPTIEDLQTQVAELQAEVGDLTRAYGRKLNETKVLRQQRNEARREVEDLQATVDSLQATVDAIVPTSLPTSTPTPRPTVAPTEESGCATPAERQYFNDASEIVSDFLVNYQMLVDELGSSSPDLSTITVLMAQFPTYYQRYLALDVPSDRLQNVHDHALATLYHMNQAAFYYGDWLDTFDDSALESAVDEIASSGDEADRAAVAIEAIQDDLCL